MPHDQFIRANARHLAAHAKWMHGRFAYDEMPPELLQSALRRLAKADIGSMSPPMVKQLVAIAVDEARVARGGQPSPRITLDDPHPDILRALSDVIKRERPAVTALVDDRTRAKCAKVGIRLANDMTVGELIDRLVLHGIPGGDYPHVAARLLE